MKSVIHWTKGNDIPDHHTMVVVVAIQDGGPMAGEAIKVEGKWYWSETFLTSIKHNVENALNIIAWTPHITLPEEFYK